MKQNTHTAANHALLRNARALAIPGAYLETCSGGVRLLLFAGDHLDYTGRYESEKAAIDAARKRCGAK